MELKLVQVQGVSQGHHSCVVRTRREFGEYHFTLFRKEEFHSPDAGAGESRSDLCCHVFSLFQFVGRQTERLPALSVVAAFLHVADRRAEQGGTVLLCHGEQRELTVEMYELLDDYLLHVASAAFHGCVESHLQFIGAIHDALSVARRRHQRLYYAWETDFL